MSDRTSSDYAFLLEPDCGFHQLRRGSPRVRSPEFIKVTTDKTGSRTDRDYNTYTSSKSEPMRLTRIIKQASATLACVTIMSLTALAADRKVDSDNTATNQRDRSGETKTSDDQSNTSADLQITQAIRRGLMKDDDLSNDAKNIKVITANGQVTLRGPVNTAEEKTKVEQITKSAAGSAQIVDQLDIKKQNNNQP